MGMHAYTRVHAHTHTHEWACMHMCKGTDKYERNALLVMWYWWSVTVKPWIHMRYMAAACRQRWQQRKLETWKMQWPDSICAGRSSRQKWPRDFFSARGAISAAAVRFSQQKRGVARFLPKFSRDVLRSQLGWYKKLIHLVSQNRILYDANCFRSWYRPCWSRFFMILCSQKRCFLLCLLLIKDESVLLSTTAHAQTKLPVQV